jgi:pyruvate dehydrogenase phosphatase
LSQAFFVGNNQPLRPPPPSFKTPPYVTARPVVTHRKLSFLPLDDAAHAKPSSKLRFLVLATDGLWDQLSSEEVVSLVGGYLSGLKGNIPKSSLPTLVPTVSGSRTVEGKSKQRTAAGEGKWAFVDDNPSTHLIRNAFGGGDKQALRKLLSIPAPYARRHRDDVTVTVVWWQDGQEEEARVAKLTADDKVKARL